MPLDGHAYLKNQGWQGKGNALRHGAISRPIAIPQKRTLAGVGKDRDEAFPFWDHVFNAAASAIQIKLSGDDDEDSSPSSTPAPSLKRTATGILSNKRPTTGTPAHLSPAPSPPHSHSPSPSSSSSSTPPPPTSRLSVLATAKRESARRNLYSRFFRGPVLGPDQVERAMVQTEAQSLEDKLAGEDKAFVDALARGKVVKGAEKSRKDSVGQGDEKSPRADDQGVKKKKRSKEKEERRRAKEARRAAKAARRAPATTDLPTHPEQPGEEGAQSARTDAAPRDERAERRERKKKRKRDGDAEDVVEVKAGKREKKKKKRRKEGCADEQETGAKAETKMKTQVKKVRFALADADEPSTPPACSDRSDAPPSAAKRHKKRKRALDED